MTPESAERQRPESSTAPAPGGGDPPRAPEPGKDGSARGTPSPERAGGGSAPRARAKLSGELADFLIELSSAIQKYAMYPPGHPALAPTAAGVNRRLSSLLHDRVTLNLGVAREQLVIEGVATDAGHPLLRSLAERLHKHQIGALSFNRGVETQELGEVLALVATEPERTGQPLGLEPESVLRGRPHVHLHPLRYERLELEEEGARRERSGHATHLWIGLAQAAMASEEAETEGGGASDPGTVARAIDRRSGEEAYDQVIVGYMLQIAEELKGSSGEEARQLRSRMSSLIAQLKPDTLNRLLHMGGNPTQRRKFLLDASQGLSVDAVLELVESASQSWNAGISGSMLRLLSKMARHAEVEDQPSHDEADAALREQVQRLVSNWNLENPNAAGYDRALERMAGGAPMVVLQTRPAHAPEPDRVVKMSLEVSEAGDATWRAVDELVERGDLAALIGILDDSPSPNGVRKALWDRLATPAAVRKVLEAETPELETLDRLLEHVGVEAAEELIETLINSSSRATRRGLFDRLARLGPQVGPLLMRRLEDPRWYVLRNMLALLGEMQELPTGLSPARFINHENPLVRWEALKLCMRLPEERDAAVVAALQDESDRSVALGLAEAERGCPPGAENRLVDLATDRGTRPEFRQMAIRALADLGSDAALHTLLRLTRGRRRWFRRRELPEPTAHVLTALTELARGWPLDSRAASVLARARRSESSEMRRAATAGASTKDRDETGQARATHNPDDPRGGRGTP